MACYRVNFTFTFLPFILLLVCKNEQRVLSGISNWGEKNGLREKFCTVTLLLVFNFVGKKKGEGYCSVNLSYQCLPIEGVYTLLI